MNHLKIYEFIIQKAKSENRVKLKKSNPDYVYYDNHHIIPACMYGSDEPYNRQLLTDKEHYVCHKLLTYIYKGNRKLACAFHRMTFGKNGKYNKSARDYAYAKELMRTIPISEETRKKHSKTKKGHLVTKETREKIRKSNTGKVVSEEAKEKNRQAHLGKKHALKTIKRDKVKKEKTLSRKGKTYKELYGSEKAKEIKQKLSKSHIGKEPWIKGKLHSQKSILKMKIAHKGKPSKKKGTKLLKETKRKISNTLTGKKQSKETIEKRVLHFRGKKQKRINCMYCGKECSPSTLMRWHNENCKKRA